MKIKFTTIFAVIAGLGLNACGSSSNHSQPPQDVNASVTKQNLAQHSDAGKNADHQEQEITKIKQETSRQLEEAVNNKKVIEDKLQEATRTLDEVNLKIAEISKEKSEIEQNAKNDFIAKQEIEHKLTQALKERATIEDNIRKLVESKTEIEKKLEETVKIRQESDRKLIEANKAREEAELKAEEERKAKEQAESKFAEEQKARENAERQSRTAPGQFGYFYSTTKDEKMFVPVTDAEMRSILVTDGSGEKNELGWKPKSVQVLDIDGQKITIDAWYDAHHRNLSDSAIARISAFGKINDAGETYHHLFLYGGQATNKNELETLKGEATYQGWAYIDDKETSVRINADFDNKTVSGILGNEDSYGIQLEDAAISDRSGYLEFSGSAKGIGRYSNFTTGNYEGKFMGREAKEVAGKTVIQYTHAPEIKIGAAFAGVKQ